MQVRINLHQRVGQQFLHGLERRVRVRRHGRVRGWQREFRELAGQARHGQDIMDGIENELLAHLAWQERRRIEHDLWHAQPHRPKVRVEPVRKLERPRSL